MSFLAQYLFDIGCEAGELFGYVPCDAVPVELLAVECRSLLHWIADCSLLQTDTLQIQISAHYGTVMLPLTAAAQ